MNARSHSEYANAVHPSLCTRQPRNGNVQHNEQSLANPVLEELCDVNKPAKLQFRYDYNDGKYDVVNTEEHNDKCVSLLNKQSDTAGSTRLCGARTEVTTDFVRIIMFTAIRNTAERMENTLMVCDVHRSQSAIFAAFVLARSKLDVSRVWLRLQASRAAQRN